MAFVPNPLPPSNVDLAQLAKPLGDAALALGSLDGLGQALPDPNLLIRSFSRVEAVASSKIEGTVTSVPELLTLELTPHAPRVRNDTREVHNYSRALEHGLAILADLPISKRFFAELHGVLVQGVTDERGMQVAPGEFKTHQNFIGGRPIQTARFVPPPPAQALDALEDLEKYINRHKDNPQYHVLIELALVHYQFETIHPFPDGNGRVGRLIIPMLLCERKVMSHPLLYLSTYFEKHYDEYIERMYDVSRVGAWNEWIEFFLRGVTVAARNGMKKAHELQALHKDYMNRVREARSSGLLAKLVGDLFELPAITIPYAASHLQISYNASKNNIQRLVDLGILAPDEHDERPQWYYAYGIIDSE
jgi:Fic family protein